MSKNNFSEETEKKLIDFFNNTIDPENFAKAIRQLSYIIALSNARKRGDKYAQKENLEQSYNWLIELGEIIYPYVEYTKK